METTEEKEDKDKNGLPVVIKGAPIRREGTKIPLYVVEASKDIEGGEELLLDHDFKAGPQ